MNDQEFGAIIEWFALSDPWPVQDIDNHWIVESWPDRIAQARGYKDWADLVSGGSGSIPRWGFR